MYYICKDKYNEEEYGLNSRDRKKFNYKKLRLTDESEEEREQQTSRKPDKKERPKKTTKNDLNKFNKCVIKKKKQP